MCLKGGTYRWIKVFRIIWFGNLLYFLAECICTLKARLTLHQLEWNMFPQWQSSVFTLYANSCLSAVDMEFVSRESRCRNKLHIWSTVFHTPVNKEQYWIPNWFPDSLFMWHHLLRKGILGTTSNHEDLTKIFRWLR